MTEMQETNTTSLLQQDSTSKDHLLRVLDWEIKHIDEEAKQPGWTIWAIYGALGAICWTLLDQIASSQLSLNHVLLYFLLAYISLDISQPLSALLNFRDEEDARSERYFKTNILASNRYQMVFEIITAILIIVISKKHAPPISLVARYAINIFYGGTILISFAGLAASYIKWPVPVPNSKSKIIWLIPTIQMLLLIIPMISYLYSFGLDEVKLPDVKVAALLTAVFFLIKKLVDKKSANPLYRSLVRIRRKLAFDELSLHDAAKQAEIAMAGMNIEDVFQEDIKIILNNIERINSEEDQFESRILALHNAWPQRLCDLNDEQRKNITDEIHSWVGKSKALLKMVDENAATIKSFKNKINFIKTYLKYQPVEIDEIMKMVAKAELDSKEKTTRYIKTFIEFSNKVEQPCLQHEDTKKALLDQPQDTVRAEQSPSK